MKLSELVKSADWKSEKHVPVIHVSKEADDLKVCVSVGDEIAHPNTLEHHIAWMKLFFVPEGKEIPVEVASYVASAHGESGLFTEPSMSVKLKANAPSLHIIKADISTEVSPIVGNQNQGEEMVKYLLNEFEQNPSELWESNMFGKSLNDLVKEQLQSKLYTMPDEIRFKIQKTLQKIINEGSNNIITIIL